MQKNSISVPVASYKTVTGRSELANDLESVYGRISKDTQANTKVYNKRISLQALINAGNCTVISGHGKRKKRMKKFSQKERSRQNALEESSVLPISETLDTFLGECIFSFLDYEDIMAVYIASSSWMGIINTCGAQLLLTLYAKKWRHKSHSTLHPTYGQSFDQVRMMYCSRRAGEVNIGLSTRSSVASKEDGTIWIKNSSLLRSFTRGKVDSVCGTETLCILPCAQTLRKKICYFEVQFFKPGSIGIVALKDKGMNYGFGSDNIVGSCGTAYGYQGGDGSFMCSHGVGESIHLPSLWPRWGAIHGTYICTESVVGCGLDYASRRVFYTLNGRFLGYAPVTVMDVSYCLAISLLGYKDQAILNTGSHPFAFDIENFCAECSQDSQLQTLTDKA